MRNQLIIIAFTSMIQMPVKAEIFDSFDVSHCTINENGCGEVLVGAARVQLNSISKNQNIASASLRIDGVGAFGFTGPGDHGDVAPSNSWWYYSAGQIQVNGVTNSLGFFFAPPRPSTIKGQYLSASTNSTAFEFVGTGIPDETNAINLEVSPNFQPTCTSADCSLNIVEQGHVIFTVTPKITNLPVNLNPEFHKHVKFTVFVQEYDTNCRTFVERVPARKLTDINDYLDYLGSDKYDRQPRGACTNTAQYDFIASVDKPVTFVVENLSPTMAGHVRYIFYANGHYSPMSGECLSSSSCKIFDVQTGGNISPVATIPVVVDNPTPEPEPIDPIAEPSTTNSQVIEISETQCIAEGKAYIQSFANITDGCYGLPNEPSEVIANVIYANTERTEATASFRGGVLVGNNFVKSTNMDIANLPNASVAFNYQPVFEHVGLTANLLIAVGIEKPVTLTEPQYDGSFDTNYFAFTENVGEIYPIDLYADQYSWGNEVAKMQAQPYITNVTLEAKQTVVLVPGDLTPFLQMLQKQGITEAMLYFFVGYALTDNTIVFNNKPIIVHVACSTDLTQCYQ